MVGLAEVVDLAFEENEGSVASDDLRQEHLAECLRRLTDRARGMIERRFRDRQSPGQIASAVGWEEGSVKVALSRARKALAECLRERFRRAP